MNILTKLRANIDRIADAVEGGVTPTPTPTPSRILVIPEQTVTTVISDPDGLAHVMLSDSSIPENYTGPLIVMFDGNQYEASYDSNMHAWAYPTGAQVTEFALAPGLQYPDLILFTPEEGTYTISAYIEESEEEQTSDFEIATLNVNNMTNMDINFAMPVIVGDNMFTGFIVPAKTIGPFSIPLYKGTARGKITASGAIVPQPSGEVSVSNLNVTVTGDGGISFMSMD